MFPDYPTMICRRCGKSFQITQQVRLDAQRMNRFECPFCSYETVGTGLRAFLKFYPRLVNSERLMAAEGIRLVGYTIGNLMGLGVFNWLKEKMYFQCHDCSHQWFIPFDPDTLHYKQNPKNFHCPRCRLTPTPKTTKELFMSLNQTFEGAIKFSHAQWDLFSPINTPAPIKEIQSKIHADKFPL